MTRFLAAHDLLDELPPWPRPLVGDLRCAPELAVLAVLHATVRAALVALAAEHPTLADLGPPDEPPTVHHARALVDTCFALAAALDSYRRAAIAAFQGCPPCDLDLPF